MKYEAVKVFDGSKAPLSETTSDAPCEIANFVAMLSSWLANVCETSSVEPSAPMSGTSTAAVGPAPSTSAGQCSKADLQSLAMF